MDEIVGNNILFITSNSTEKEALESVLKERGVTLKKGYRSLSSRIKVGVLDGYPVSLLCADRGSYKSDSVGILLPKVLAYLKPKLAILTGFSYGRRDSVNLHDVVVSREVISLVDLKASNSGIDFRSFPQVQSLIDDDCAHKLVSSVAPKIGDKVRSLGLKAELHIGSILSGEIFAEGENVVAPLFAKFANSLAGDMEAQPFASHCSGQNTPWIVVKSPSDFGGGTSGTTNAQAFSAKMSAISSVEIGSFYVRSEKFTCPENILKVLNSPIAEPIECLVMPQENKLFANSEYAATIRKFVTMLALPEVYDQDFQSHLIGLVKEIAENAAKHERSNEVYLRGNEDRLTVEYDGQSFNPIDEFPGMRVSGGGKEEFDTFVQMYARTNALVDIEWEYADGRNRMTFKFLQSNSDLRKNFYCSLCLDVEEIREYAFGSESNFSEFSQCDTVWLSADDVFVSVSDWFLLLQLIMKIPKKVNHIKVRGCPTRLISAFRARFQSDPRVEFI